MRHPGPGRRLAAALFDALFFAVFALAVWAPLAWTVGRAMGAERIAPFATVGAVAFWFALAAAFESGPWGATPGKKALGLRVIVWTGRRLTYVEAFQRNVWKFAAAVPAFLGILPAAFTEHRQGLHDLVAGSWVLVERRHLDVGPSRRAGANRRRLNAARWRI